MLRVKMVYFWNYIVLNKYGELCGCVSQILFIPKSEGVAKNNSSYCVRVRQMRLDPL